MRTLILVVVLTSGVLAQSGDPDSLPAARERYASADYHGALEMLEQLAAANPSVQDRQSIDLYRTFCLIALERVSEANDAIAVMIARDPLYRPADAEVPPRVRPMFSDRRRAALPAIIQSRYERAKMAFDASDYKTAADGFTLVLLALADPDIAREASRAPLADLRVLAVGFRDLAVRAMIVSAAPVAPPVPAVVSSAPAPVLEAPRIETPTIHDSDDAAVVAPVTIAQDMPRLHRPTTTDQTGVLVVVINEAGRVESAGITQPLDSYYDALLLQAVKTWRYQPARRNGVPVKYRKRIQLTLPRQTN